MRGNDRSAQALSSSAGGPSTAAIAKGLEDAANAFADTYWVAWAMVLLTVIPAMFLPRKHEETHLLDDMGVPPVVVH